VAQGVPGRLRPRIILAFQHYKGGRSSAKGTGRLYPRRNPWYSLSEAESSSGHMVLSGVPRKKSPVTPPGIDPGTVRLAAQCLNFYVLYFTFVCPNSLHFSPSSLLFSPSTLYLPLSYISSYYLMTRGAWCGVVVKALC